MTSTLILFILRGLLLTVTRGVPLVCLIMAEAHLQPGTSSVTQQVDTRSPSVVLKLRKPKNDKKVKWEQGTVDNEGMNKKKSKCCCIYEKPKLFGESSSEDEDDDCTFNCHGHKKKCYQQFPQGDDTGGDQSSHETPS